MKLKYLLPAVALVATQANAEVNINGFATIAGGFTSDESESLYQYTDNLNFDNDSLFGVQLSSELEEDLSFTAQLISRGRDEWQTDVEWAYLSWEANENLRFQFGKQRTPYFMYTEFFDVGFAYPWINPPAGVYDLPVGTVTGLNTIASVNLGETEHSFEFLVGQEKTDAFLDGQNLDTEIDNLFLVSWTMNYDWLMLRASRTQATITLNVVDPLFQQLLGGWRATAASPFDFSYVADALEFTEDDAVFSEIGMRIELGDFQFITEFTEFESDDNFTGDQESFYFTTAYRVNDWTFHVTYGEDETTNDFSILNGIPVGVDPGLDALIGGTNLTLQSRFEDANYTTFGFRWDFNPAAALKVEWTDFTDEQFGNDASLMRFAVTTFF